MDCEIGTGGLSLTQRRTQLISRLHIQIAYLDPLQWHAWLGITQTLLLLLIPNKLVQRVKSKLKSYKSATI